MKKWKFRIGVIFIILSVIIFLSLIIIIPFLGINLKFKLSFSTGLIVAGEIMYWTGTLLIGKEVWKKYKSWLKSGKWLEKKE